MDFTLDGGTDQQQAWVNDAIANCTYPLDDLSTAVTVQWVSVMPNADSRHPYMVTQVADDGSCTISIIDWADDAGAAGNQGLPNPRADLKTFYEASFVHELGHVVTYNTFDPDGADTDGRIATMCGYFWTANNDPPVRRYGTPDDWDAQDLSWADEIREGVAEMFKVAFYAGEPIFRNRTNWNIDADNWAGYLVLISPPSGMALINTWDDTFPLDDDQEYAVFGWEIQADGELEVDGPVVGSPQDESIGIVVPEMTGDAYTHAFGSVKIGSITPLNPSGQGEVQLSIATQPAEGDPWYTAIVGLALGGSSVEFSISTKNELLTAVEAPGNLNDPSPIAQNMFVLIVDSAAGAQIYYTSIDVPPFPCWITLGVNFDTWSAQLWDTDPWEDGNTPLTTLDVAAPVGTYTFTAEPSAGPAMTGVASDSDVVDGEFSGLVAQEAGPIVIVNELRLDFEPPNPGVIPVTADYPLTRVAGSLIAAKAGLRGQLALDVATAGRLPFAGAKLSSPASSGPAPLSVPFDYATTRADMGLRGQRKA